MTAKAFGIICTGKLLYTIPVQSKVKTRRSPFSHKFPIDVFSELKGQFQQCFLTPEPNKIENYIF